MNRAQRREHGHLLDKTHCRSRLRVFSAYWHKDAARTICDDCGVMGEVGGDEVRLDEVRQDEQRRAESALAKEFARHGYAVSVDLSEWYEAKE